MSAVIVGSPEELVQAGSRTQEILSSGYAFKPGKTYAEFRSGDKIAKYGLVGLITGGAAVVALKTGVFKYLWKILVVGGVAMAGFFKRLFGRKSTG